MLSDVSCPLLLRPSYLPTEIRHETPLRVTTRIFKNIRGPFRRLLARFDAGRACRLAE